MEKSVENHIPPQPAKSYRVVLELNRSEKRLDGVLLPYLKAQKDNINLAILTRGSFKKLFQDRKILIKGQPARPSSAINKGITYVDILGF
jgi:hypothetical protein